jgi:hypothetical protein
MPVVDNYTLRRLLDKQKKPIEINSQCVENLDYSYENDTLTVHFHERGTYEYYHVPLPVFVDFSEAASKGQYFNLYIRNAGYSYSRID